MATKTGTKIKRAISKMTPASPKERYDTLHELLILKLQTLHDVENQIIEALPKMADAAKSSALRDALLVHLGETKIQEQRIDQALTLLGDAERGKVESQAIRGLIADGEWCIKNIKDENARDVALVSAAQDVEHYEIAGYGSACTWAEEMRHTEVADLLTETLQEEKATDEKLISLATTGGINAHVD